jgi:NAD(P)-dependent dehydrogenase (short-subunit alcohol dehydrogenase family)
VARWSVVWITGASSGIGRELAIRLAKEGSKVAVSARSADKLAEVAALQPGIVAFPLDVTDGAATQATVAAIEALLGPIDLAVLNAGTWDPMSAKDFSGARANASMQVNYIGPANGIEALSPRFIARKAGHIALVSSVAGYRGMPQASAYAPTKAAVINLAESLRPDFARHGVTLSVINPGFVATPMTAVNQFPMPFLMPVDKAVEQIVSGLAKKKFEIAFPWQLVAVLKIMRVLPYPVYFWVARTFLTPKKPNPPPQISGR